MNHKEDKSPPVENHAEPAPPENRDGEFENLGGSGTKPERSKGRKLEPIERKEGESAPDSTELLQKIKDAEVVEVAFAERGKEIEALPAKVIRDNEAWTATSIGLVLNTPIEIGPLQEQICIEGYGLLLDDKLVAYQERFEPIDIMAGRTWELAADVVF
jgi:hypothetical protein